MHNPDAQEQFRWRYEAACKEFSTNEISEAVFLASLYALGYRGRRLKDELSYQICLRGNAVKPKSEGFISGLPVRGW